MIVRVAVGALATVSATLGLAVGAFSSTRVRHLQAWAAEYRHPPVGIATSAYRPRMHVVRHLAAGRYRLSVVASDAVGFQLVGPGVDRHTRVTLGPPHGYAVNTTWTVTFRSGIYNYRAIGPFAPEIRPATGTFRVP